MAAKLHGSPLVVTAKQANASATYSYTLSPVNGANRVVLTGGTSTTSSPPTTTTTTPPTSVTNAPGTMSSAQLIALGLNGAFVAPADQGWNVQSTREKYIETSELKLGFLNGGAVISYGALKRNNRNLINSNNVFYNDDPADFRFNSTRDDLGRQWMMFSDYTTPGPNDNGGQGFILKNGKKDEHGLHP